MKKLLPIIFCGLYSANAFAGSTLFYSEAQGIVGYSGKEHKAVYHSADKHDAMQKNSFGFDLLHKLSGKKEIGVLSHFRLAWLITTAIKI